VHVCRALLRTKTAMLMLLAVEKLSLVTAMEVGGVQTFVNLPAPATDHFFHFLFHNRPQARLAACFDHLRQHSNRLSSRTAAPHDRPS